MSELDQLYQQLIIDHSKERHGCKEISAEHVVSHQVNPSCGDEVEFGLVVKDGLISDISWQGQGCSISQASISIMNDLILGKSLEEVDKLYESFLTLMHSKGKEVDEEVLDHLQDASAFQGVSKYPARIKCALLGWMALRDSVAKTH
ncbi:SUF system NifU family Fe-S cluster assembly protein [Actinomyces sp. zg-332]|uniref:Fe-S cluster assembly sulfur transfer protein SufU n=1 Tax=Actinomyces sp. zg-332 TaxID=2708340 RepID=UPI00141E9A2F|nr:SUF system NifU family Fe-S cluster assembly protein [Actinomyces sp. zg-332]QPK94587.1 SUF system NifU family Fe-S cluster assembly protein [Actinomyces sp. zg-332]